MTDDELEALVASLPEDHRTALDEICGAREGGFTDPSSRTLAMRAVTRLDLRLDRRPVWCI